MVQQGGIGRTSRPVLALVLALVLSLALGLGPAPGRMVKHFINLTNGLEAVPSLLELGVVSGLEELMFIRIQSTHCENTNHYGILESLDTTFLMHCALGNACIIYDYGSRGTGQLIGSEDHRWGIPRAYWWGIEWIRHALADIWNLEEANQPQRFVRGYNTKPQFDAALCAMPKTLRRRLKYFRPFLKPNATLHIYPVYARTENDGEKEFYWRLTRELYENGAAKTSGGKRLDVIPPSLVTDDEVTNYIEQLLPPGHHIYRTADFLGLGRSSGARLQE